METNKDFENMLQKSMSLDELQKPSRLLVSEARKKIAARKKPTPESNDLFSVLAAFLNFKIKLYQAVLGSCLIAVTLLFFNREDGGAKNELTGDDISNIASVRSSTVLSSIYTFGLNKKPYDERSSN